MASEFINLRKNKTPEKGIRILRKGQGEIDLDNWGDAVEIPPEIIARLTMPEPSPEELAEHEKMLDKADKQCKATCAWRKALGIGVEEKAS